MVYLIHFKSKLSHAQHYIGYCEPTNLGQRIDTHMSGQGSKLLRAATEAGIEWMVVHVWHDADRKFERKLKRRKDTPRFCPACTGKDCKLRESA